MKEAKDFKMFLSPHLLVIRGDIRPVHALWLDRLPRLIVPKREIALVGMVARAPHQSIVSWPFDKVGMCCAAWTITEEFSVLAVEGEIKAAATLNVRGAKAEFLKLENVILNRRGTMVIYAVLSYFRMQSLVCWKK